MTGSRNAEREGTLRSWPWIDDVVHDAIRYSLLRSDVSRE